MRNRSMTTAALAAGLVWAVSAAPAAEDTRAADVLAAARNAIGGKTLDALKTFSLDASVQRNVGSMQMAADVEILLDLPDRYLRSDVSSGMTNATIMTGFDGQKVVRPANATAIGGGAMVIRMGPGGPMPAGEKPGPEEQKRIEEMMLKSSRAEISRLMLGWFATAHPTLDVQYTYAGEAESSDGKAHVIDAKTADGFNARLFIDEETKLPLMVTYQGPQPRVITRGGPRGAAGGSHGGDRVQRRELSEEERKKLREVADREIKELQSLPSPMVDFTLYFDEWRAVDGVRFPHRIRRAAGGTTNEEWTVNKVRVNPRIDAKKFEG